MNMLGLWLLGPFTEFALGSGRFVLVYLLAGIGSMTTVLVCSSGAQEISLTVGASGCVMGLIGASGALMLRGWLREKAPVAKRRLVVMLMIVSVQTLFDSVVPHVSMTAHLSGAFIGFLSTMVLQDRLLSRPASPDRRGSKLAPNSIRAEPFPKHSGCVRCGTPACTGYRISEKHDGDQSFAVLQRLMIMQLCPR